MSSNALQQTVESSREREPAARVKFIAVQTGARRGYAVPAILDRAGMLERFYTDVCGSVGMGAAASALQRIPGIGASLGKLAGRRLPAAIVDKTRTFGGPTLRREVGQWRRNGDAADDYRRSVDFSRRWGEAMIRAGFGDATHVFTMLGEGGPFVAEAKRRGLTVVSEIYILLSSLRIVAEERRRFPEWETPSDEALVEAIEQGAREGLLAHSDWFVCPSAAVRDDLTENWGVAAERTAVVPYGMDPSWLELAPRPQRGRVLFAGTAELRKGIHYLALAAEELHRRGVEMEFHVAGQVTPKIAARPECRRLKFLGRVPRAAVHEEFQQADVFVLPSLAEGSAEVTYEALAAGVPVITTAAAGSVVRDGIEGRIVAERDSAGLAEAIAEVVGDREMRERMATAAGARAREFTWERYGERLLAALRSFEQRTATGAST